jgi:hypothetical protein
MAANSSSMQDDLSDVIPGGVNGASSGISPYQIMAAQKEAAQAAAAGKAPPVGGAVHQLGLAVMKQKAQKSAAGMPAPQPGDPDVSKVNSIADAAKIMNASPLMKVGSIADAAQFQNPSTGVPAPTPQDPAGTAGSTQGDPSQAPDLVAGLKNMIGAQKQMEDAGIKNPRSSIEDDLKTQNENSSKLRVNSPPGSYSQGSGEVQGYGYTKNADGTYTRDEQPDPNSLFQKQQSAIDKLQALVAARAARGQPTRPTDLTGLMMAADFENGTDKFAKSYAGQRAAQVADQQDAQKLDQQQFSDQAEALKEQQDLYKNAQAGALGIMGGGSVGSVNNVIQTAKQLEAAGNTAKGVNPNQGKMTDAQFQTAAGKYVDQGQKKDGALNDLARMLALGNPTADNMSAIAGAKAMAGTSRINTQEIQSFKTPDSSLWGRVDQIMGRVSNGQYTPEDRSQLMQLYQQLSTARKTEAGANMGIIHNMNENMRMNPQDKDLIDTVYGGAMQPNVANTNFNLSKAGPPNHVTPVNKNQNYDGSRPLPAGATPAMKQARLKFLQQKGGQ